MNRLRRTVRLNDAPGAPRYIKTVRQILADEVGHAGEHLGALPTLRRQRKSSR